MGKLTARMVQTAQTGRYRDGDGVGLILLVKKTGTRSWVQRIRIDGRDREIGLGGYPRVSLAMARQKALTNAQAVAMGVDVVAEKRANRQRLTFKEAAERACEELKSGWKSADKEAKAFNATLTRYTFRRFGQKDVAEVTRTDIRQAVLDCRAKAPNVSLKLQHRILAVFKYAVANGLRADNPATADALALPKLERTVTHNRALPYTDVAAALDAVKRSKAWPATKLALEFVVLTAARSGEVRGAKWPEVDLEKAIWTIPAGRMKMSREHRVPLSKKALAVLAEAEVLRDRTELVFPSATGRMLSDNTLSKLLRENAIGSTVHGFRASFRTWVQEQTNVPREVAELALAHVNTDKVEAAYARSDMFDKRCKLMTRWARYLSASKGEVVSLRGNGE